MSPNSALAQPCRKCNEPVEPGSHCDKESCDWWKCTKCGAIGSDHARRYIRSLGKQPERQEDGSIKNMTQWESVSYGPA